jgi:hypothetical protein
VRVDNIPPLSSLDAMVMGVTKALKAEQERGIVDLEAVYDPHDSASVPFLSYDGRWVKKAHVILSAFGRPMGWHLQFDNRSIVHALLTHARENQVLCAWRKVEVQEFRGREEEVLQHFHEISDSTVRIENCPPNVQRLNLVNLLSRYDMKDGNSIVKWGVEKLEETNVPRTFLVHFADASWARAAVREKQSHMIKGRELRLAQYPKQLL